MILGIDLGTTNSLVAVWQDGEARVIPNALGHRLTPSAVGIDNDGSVLVGLAARERLLTHPEKTAVAFKRYMGTEREIRLGAKTFRPEDLSSLVLRSLKADAEAYLGEPCEEAVVTVPAYFNDRQRKATKIAAELAGLRVDRLLNEPTAAALAYGLHHRDRESKFLVLDLGGGTFDVSVVELFEGVMEVRASAGDNFLGGEDFVDVLVKGFLENAGDDAPSIEELLGKPLQALRAQAEAAKRKLSHEQFAEMKLTWKERSFQWTVDEPTLQSRASALLERLTTPTERALRDCGVNGQELDQILLVGGATRMPIVRKLVARIFGRFPDTELNPDETVGLGAAVQGGLLARDEALDDVVMTDVCPYTLGVEISKELRFKSHRAGYFHPIIERNTVIPASRIDRLFTVDDNQDVIQLRIFQGESRLVKDNIPLGSLSVRVPPAPASEQCVDVRFTYDPSGLLEVEATVVSTQRARRLVIEQAPGVMTPEEIQARLRALEKLKIHPREGAENRAVLARAERVYEGLLGEIRDFVGEHIAGFEAVLGEQKPDAISEARAALRELLDEIEGETVF